MYFLQNRWKIENNILRYYGLRNKENMFKNIVKLNSKQLNIIKKLPAELTADELKVISSLVGKQVVTKEQLIIVPKSLEEARFCKNCIANDFMIPGIEFDEEGLCPLCQTKEETKELKSVVPLIDEIPVSKKSRFDVAVFYTGGKDSTYLLYYLSKVKKLRVLALTWELPYMSECARKSIENAKERFNSVEFITRRVANDDLRKIYTKLYELAGNTCACPSLAYLLFYPELVANKVAYFIAGNEPVQLLGLYYNNMAPKIVYNFPKNKFFNGLINIGRVLTLRPPLKSGQFHTLITMKQLAYGDNIFKKFFGYRNLLVENIVKAIHEVPQIANPLKRAIRSSSWSGNIPAFVQIDLNSASGGIYDWRKIKNILVDECGWVQPDESIKGLHTSCSIEKCKEYSQFIRFYNMESTMIAFSALEIALASRDKNITREDALAELKTSIGFSIDEIPECTIMKEYFKK